MAKQQDGIVIQTVERERVTIPLVGTSGLYCHRMSAKAKHQLMLGGKRKTMAEKAQLKHDPIAEFHDSMHVRPGMFEGTDIVFPAMALKSAMATAALMVDGVKKTDVHRLVYIEDEFVPVYGVPRIRMDITRSADINKTPDVRTRAYLPRVGYADNRRFCSPCTFRQGDHGAALQRRSGMRHRRLPAGEGQGQLRHVRAYYQHPGGADGSCGAAGGAGQS